MPPSTAFRCAAGELVKAGIEKNMGSKNVDMQPAFHPLEDQRHLLPQHWHPTCAHSHEKQPTPTGSATIRRPSRTNPRSGRLENKHLTACHRAWDIALSGQCSCCSLVALLVVLRPEADLVLSHRPFFCTCGGQPCSNNACSQPSSYQLTQESQLPTTCSHRPLLQSWSGF